MIVCPLFDALNVILISHALPCHIPSHATCPPGAQAETEPLDPAPEEETSELQQPFEQMEVEGQYAPSTSDGQTASMVVKEWMAKRPDHFKSFEYKRLDYIATTLANALEALFSKGKTATLDVKSQVSREAFNKAYALTAHLVDARPARKCEKTSNAWSLLAGDETATSCGPWTSPMDFLEKTYMHLWNGDQRGSNRTNVTCDNIVQIFFASVRG